MTGNIGVDRYRSYCDVYLYVILQDRCDQAYKTVDR